MTLTVRSIWRYPVKSMLGERVERCEIGPGGISGDRAFALVDLEDGRVASAKNPRKWGSLLRCQARLVGGGGGGANVAEITLPDGSTLRTDDDAALVDAALSNVTGRAVHLATSAPEDRSFEEVWPDIDGLAPEPVIAGTNIGTDEDGERISRFPLGAMAPEGTFFDLAVLHLLTTSTTARLQQLTPTSDFDERRYRPNLVLDTDDEGPGFLENEWPGATLHIGGAASVSVSIPTMRCIMTTLAQGRIDGGERQLGDLPRDRDTLRTIASANRVDIQDWGTWACAGVYGGVTTPGAVQVGDPVDVVAPTS